MALILGDQLSPANPALEGADRVLLVESRAARDCRFVPERRTGEDACPVTRLCWDFMARNEERLAGNRRLRGQLASLRRMDAAELAEVRAAAAEVRAALVDGRATGPPPPP